MPTMRAAVFEAPGKIAMRECPIPTPGDDEVLIRVAACGICGTDRHMSLPRARR